MHAARAGCLGPADELEIIEHSSSDCGDFLDLLPRDAGHRIEVDAQLVRMIEILGSHRMWMQLEASEIREPRERRRVARHDFLRSPTRGEAQLDHFDPRRAAVRRALLIEVLALDAVGVAHQHVRSPAGAAQRSFAHGDVVTDEVELRVLRLREQHLVRIRDRDLAPGDIEDFSCAVLDHNGGQANRKQQPSPTRKDR